MEENIQINFNEFLKIRAEVLTIRVPKNEISFHKLKDGMKVKVQLVIYKEEEEKEEEE